jgi:hypothetical protein
MRIPKNISSLPLNGGMMQGAFAGPHYLTRISRAARVGRNAAGAGHRDNRSPPASRIA